MNPKEVHYGEEARAILKRGVDAVAKAVKVTLGPKGRNVIIDTGQNRMPVVSKDGVTVAREVILEDQGEDLGAKAIKMAAQKTVVEVGDGTTTCVILTQMIYNKGIEAVDNGANPVDVKKGIDQAVETVVETLQAYSIDVKGDENRIRQVAYISTNGDDVHADLITKGVKEIGDEGVLYVEESVQQKSSLNVVSGLKLNEGFMHPMFINDPTKAECTYDNPLIVLCADDVEAIPDVEPILTAAVNDIGRPLVFIVKDMAGEALSTLLLNRKEQNLRVCVVRAPGMGDQMSEILEDIAMTTGAKVISEDSGMLLKNIQPLEHCGTCDKIVIGPDSTIIMGGECDQKAIDERVQTMKAVLEKANDENITIMLKKRIANLAGGIGVIKAGAPTEIEMKEISHRIDDAIHATRAAIEEGIVAGGGAAYIHAIKSLETLPYENDDIGKGIAIIAKSLYAPAYQIMLNTGRDPKEEMKLFDVEGSHYEEGWNARTELFTNLVDKGVIDPTKVARVALENAASAAGILLTTECALVIKEDNVQKVIQERRKPQNQQ